MKPANPKTSQPVQLVELANQKGQSLLEVILAVAIFALMAGAMVSLVLGSQEALLQGGQSTEADFLADEAIEGLRSIRDGAWNEINYTQAEIQKSGNEWILVDDVGLDGELINNKYTRTITFSDVCRDVFGNQISCASGDPDIQTKKATVKIDWQRSENFTPSLEKSTYFTNWESLDWFEDISVDFNDGTFTDTEVSGTLGDGDGAVILEITQGGGYTWNCVSKKATYDLSTTDNAYAVAVSGNYVYVGQDDVLRAYDVTDPEAATLEDSFTVGGRINSIVVSGDYAYLATEDNSRELDIIDISTPSSLSLEGSYNADSDANGLDVFVLGDRVYLVTAANTSGGDNPEFYIIDISSKSSPTLADSNSHYDSGDADVNGVAVLGNYAHLATANSSAEYLVLNISDESNITQADSLNAGGSRILTDVEISGQYAYVTTSDWERFYSIDISNPNNVQAEDFVDVNATLNRVFLSGDYAFLAMETNPQELIIADISDPNNLTVHKNLDYDGPVNDVAVRDNYIYVASDNNSAEMGIFEEAGGTSWKCIELAGTIDTTGSNSGSSVVTRQEGSNIISYIVAEEGNQDRLYAYDVTSPTSPTQLDVHNSGTNVNGLAVSGNYAYLATTHNSKEMIVIDISNPSNLSEAGSYNADSRGDAYDVYASGNRAYLVTNRNRSGGINPEFYILNVSTPSNPVLADPNSHFDTGQRVNSVFVSGDYAYLATVSNTKELQVLDISDESNVTEADSYNTSGGNNGEDVFVAGDYAYLVNGNGNDFFIFDVSTPSNVSLESSYDTGDDATSSFVYSDYAFISSYSNQNELQILDISDKANPAPLNSFDNSNDDAFEVYVFNEYVYLANADGNGEVKIIRQTIGGGGGGASGYKTIGDYISSAFDMGASAKAIQTIEWEEIIPGSPGFDLTLQIRTAANQASLGSASWSSAYTDPNGDLIDVSRNGDRWIQYRANLTGDGTDTPVLSNIMINYK